jgi:D-sedoheptulose 7-phosphate isomerase
VIQDAFEEVSRGLRLVLEDKSFVAAVERAADLLITSFSAGNKLLVFGNGGSAADALHICGELVGRFARERRGLPAIALSANQAVLTAWGNDYSFDTIFARQVEALGVRGDVAWGISTSGNSRNVVNALKAGRAAGLRTIALTGQAGGEAGGVCDVLLAVPLTSTPRVQEVHTITYHIICAAVEESLFG